MRALLVVPNTKLLAVLAGLLTVLFIGFTVCFHILDQSLPHYNIIQFEFARTPQYALQMFACWGQAGMAVARWSLNIDFVYMPVYALTFAALTLLAARAAPGWAQPWGLWLALAPFVAWAFDLLENIGLLAALSRADNPPAFALAVSALAATLKFSLLALTLLYMSAVIIQRIASRLAA